jgi:glucose/arabinose dehydrogenase
MRRTIEGFLAAALVAIATPPAAFAQLRGDLVVTGLTQPIAFVQDPSDATVQIVAQQNGRVRVVRNGTLLPDDYLNLVSEVLNSGEQGLLGFAFAPNYATSGRVFVNFINRQSHTVIARFTRSAADPLRADPSSRFDLRWPNGQREIQQPFSNHNGGNLVFGPDGYLYIGMGDGGAGDDPAHRAQNPQTLLGKMLRLDVNVADNDPEGYNVPANNPFVGRGDVLGEIWSFGLRNPWRWSFDDPRRGGTGALIIGDVGQNAFEEIDYEPAGRGGRNYGWRNREGAHNNVTSLPPFSTPLIDPIFEYGRSTGTTVTGGFVYRGTALGLAFRGRYFFADFGSNRVWSLKLTIDAATGEATASDLQEHTADVGAAAILPSSFGVDANGEIYIVNYLGNVHRLRNESPVPIPPEPTPPTPTPPGPVGGRTRPPNVPAIGIGRPRSTTPATLAALLSAPPSSQLWIRLVDLDDDGELDVVWQSLLRPFGWGIVLSGSR